MSEEALIAEASPCPMCGASSCITKESGMTYCKACRFWWEGYQPYKDARKWKIKRSTQNGLETTVVGSVSEMIAIINEAEKRHAAVIEASLVRP